MNYRLLLKEIHDLISVCDEEFSGQVKLHIPDETQPYMIYFTVTPNKGLYEHASFEFSITVTRNYPNASPSVKCYTPIIHPNIDYQYSMENVCVNLLYSWERCYRIKDVIHAIIFLFYEPNRDDCLTPSSLFNSEESYRESVKLFLKGGIVDGHYFPPNKSWCEWQKNSETIEEVNTLKVQNEIGESYSLTKCQASYNSSQYCKEIYARSESSLSNFSSPDSEHQIFTQNVSLLCLEITIEKIGLITEKEMQTFKGCNISRYYYVEFYSCDHSDFDVIAISRSWIPSFPLSVDGKLNLMQKSSQFNPRIVRGKESDFKYSCESIPSGSVYNSDNDNSECEGDCPSLKGSITSDKTESINEVDKERRSETNEVVDVMESMSFSDTEVLNEYNTFEDFKSNLFVEPNRYYVDRSMILFKRIEKPWWWIFFQTRWAPFIAPGRFYYVEGSQETEDATYNRIGTCSHLRVELNRLSTKYQNCDNLFLVDSLALSPFSPILNRITLIPPSDIPHRCFKFCWRSIEWLSLTWAWFPPPTTKESEHLILPGAGLLTTMCWISNWIAYASRVELYHSCLGYSRRLFVLPMESMATSCLSPASLVCGHCPLLDGWPLWLLTHASRLMCSWMLSMCVSLSDYLSQKSCSLHFVFDDSDEI
ncbi:unnamed protein product [Trichobilharzia szidati]|nr:unnamed protein product [Trichobilharzia szidati]